MSDLLYDYYPTLSAAKKAVKRIKRRHYHAIIRKVFMSDQYVVYLRDSHSKDNDKEH